MTAGQDGLALVWDGATGQRVASLSRAGSDQLFDAAFVGEGHDVAATLSGSPGSLLLWSVAGDEPVGRAEGAGTLGGQLTRTSTGALALSNVAGELRLWHPPYDTLTSSELAKLVSTSEPRQRPRADAAR